MLHRGAPNWLRAWALRLAVLRGMKRATVTLARRIGVVLHRMWRDATAFCFTREAACKFLADLTAIPTGLDRDSCGI